MPLRQAYYPYATRAQRVGEALGEGVSDIGDAMMAGNQKNKQQQRELNRQLEKEWIDKVSKGDSTPDEAERAMAAMGIKVPPGAMRSFEPTVTSRLQRVMGTGSDVEKATTPAAFPTVESKNLDLASRDLNPMAFSNVPAQFEPLQPDQTNPAAADVYSAKRQALTQSEAAHPTVQVKGMSGTGADMQPTETPNFYDAFKPVGSQLTPSAGPIATGPTAGQSGAFEGAKAVAAQPGQTEAELAKLLGTTYSPQVTRAKAEQAFQDEMARVRAQGDPKSLQVLAARTGVETKAKNDAMLAGVPPQYANTMLHHTADGRSYFVDDPQAPPEYKKAIYQAAGQNSMKVLNPKQAGVLDEIQTARANMGTIMSTLAQYAPKTPEGRILGGPRNTFEVLAQTNPELAAMQGAMFAPTIALNRALVQSGASSLGMRLQQYELDKFLRGSLSITDDYPTLYHKVRDFNQFLTNAENSALGR